MRIARSHVIRVLASTIAITSAGCGSGFRATAPAWQRSARLDTHAAPVLLRRQHTPGQRYGACFVSQTHVDLTSRTDRDSRPRRAPGDLASRMAWVEVITLPGPRAVDVQQLAAGSELELTAGGLGDTSHLNVEDPAAVRHLTDRNAPVAGNPSDAWAAVQHSAGAFELLGFISAELLDGEFPAHAVAPGASWQRPVLFRRRDVATAWMDEYRVTQRYVVTGIERAADGPWLHLEITGPLARQTRSPVVRSDVRAEVAGGARVSLRDGHTGQWWYEQRGTLAFVLTERNGARATAEGTVVVRTEGAVAEVGASWAETPVSARALLRPCAPREADRPHPSTAESVEGGPRAARGRLGPTADLRGGVATVGAEGAE